jgi:hypothetical protein
MYESKHKKHGIEQPGASSMSNQLTHLEAKPLCGYFLFVFRGVKQGEEELNLRAQEPNEKRD